MGEGFSFAMYSGIRNLKNISCDKGFLFKALEVVISIE
jgi:hypothetical protein